MLISETVDLGLGLTPWKWMWVKERAWVHDMGFVLVMLSASEYAPLE